MVPEALVTLKTPFCSVLLNLKLPEFVNQLPPANSTVGPPLVTLLVKVMLPSMVPAIPVTSALAADGGANCFL